VFPSTLTFLNHGGLNLKYGGGGGGGGGTAINNGGLNLKYGGGGGTAIIGGGGTAIIAINDGGGGATGVTELLAELLRDVLIILLAESLVDKVTVNV
jgi:hypothetical protein